MDGSSASRSAGVRWRYDCEHAADGLAAALAQACVDAQRRVDEARLLHVDADEVAERRRVVDDGGDVLEGELLVDQQPEMRQLHRHVDLQPALGDPVEDGAELVHDDARLVRRAHVLTEQRRVRAQPARVQPREHVETFVERLAGDEARAAEPHPVAADERADAAVRRRGEDRLPERCVDGSADPDCRAGAAHGGASLPRRLRPGPPGKRALRGWSRPSWSPACSPSGSGGEPARPGGPTGERS